ncbi:edfbee27-c516-4382-a4dc-9c1dfa4326f5 [Thermothielavioides terrestris]|uniref:Phosphatidylinositol transfer protein SFH5 n=1 Tax=Thermothielavioides terrestris TaxID=2587410 RepID=A0A446BQS3_9PEZI|nr:edfbee27-c516-4382-a4dc-9c1dfa4326f5 [Thermothielavioides terrestris]
MSSTEQDHHQDGGEKKTAPTEPEAVSSAPEAAAPVSETNETDKTAQEEAPATTTETDKAAQEEAPATKEEAPATQEEAPATTTEADKAAQVEAPATTTETDVPASSEPKPAAAATATTTGTTDTTVPAPIAQLWALAKASGHPEIWGVTLADPADHVPTRIILQKYLNANDGDLSKAKDQLSKTLEWRAKMKPLDLVRKVFSKAKFDGLGYVTKYAQEGSTEPEGVEVFTWNIYGAVKSIDDTFGKLEEFLEWRVALMEIALQELDLASATKPITADYDPYKIFQVHDYKSLSFLRQSSLVRSASTETIRVFAQNYPELLKEKFFVNVPAVMGFIYAFMKLFVAPKTIKKFHPMANGANLAKEFAASKVSGLGERLPANYGGKGGELSAQGKGPLLE